MVTQPQANASCRNLCSRDHIRKGWMHSGLKPRKRQPPPAPLLFSNFVVQRQTILFINTQMILALIENQMKITSIQGVSPHNRVVILGELCCLTHKASVIISLFKRMFKYFGEIVTQKFFISFQPYNRVPLTPPLLTPLYINDFLKFYCYTCTQIEIHTHTLPVQPM